MKESDIQQLVRLKAGKLGIVLFRNNTGSLKNPAGRWVQFGLCKGSSDLIGWNRVTVTEDMVGKTVPIFTAVEVKTLKGKATKEQIDFINTVKKCGGISGIVRSEKDLEELINNAKNL